jgi:hypothetical protein
MNQDITNTHEAENNHRIEEAELRQVLGILHALPRREPVIDLWAELGPKVAAVQAEESLGLAQKARLRGASFLSNFATGAILFTQAMAMNTQSAMQKYVVQDARTSEEA